MSLYYYEVGTEILSELWDTWFGVFGENWDNTTIAKYRISCEAIVRSIRARINVQMLIKLDGQIYEDFSYELTKFFFFSKIEESPNVNYTFVAIEEVCRELKRMGMYEAIQNINKIFLRNNIMIQFFNNYVVLLDPALLEIMQISSVITSLINKNLAMSVGEYLNLIDSYSKKNSLFKDNLIKFILTTLQEISGSKELSDKNYDDTIKEIERLMIVDKKFLDYIDSFIFYVKSINKEMNDGDMMFCIMSASNIIILLSSKMTQLK